MLTVACVCSSSIEIEPKINVVKWWKKHTQHMHLLTSNGIRAPFFALFHASFNMLHETCLFRRQNGQALEVIAQGRSQTAAQIRRAP